MEIVCTFVPHLYAFKLPENDFDELEMVLDQWEDPSYLHTFFTENEKDLDIPIREAIMEVRREVVNLRKKLITLSSTDPTKLKELFKNLDNNEFILKPLSRQKAPHRWLRIYAIRIDEGVYIITGGAIKLNGGAIGSNKQHRMQDRPHTLKELIKINMCRDFLQSEGVIDKDSFNDIFEL